jgi:ankyrin repeat protein
LEKGGDIEAKTKDGWKPLHIACQNGHESIVSLLLEKGACWNDSTPVDESCPLGNDNGTDQSSLCGYILKQTRY